MHIIEDKEIKLINCNPEIIEIILKGQKTLSQDLNIEVDSQWSLHGKDIFAKTKEQISKPDQDTRWWSYLLIYKKENKLIGNGGYKGNPEKGGVEIGYEISPQYRNRGLTTRMVKLLIDEAFRYDTVTHIKANTLAEKNASASVLQKLNFQLAQNIQHGNVELFWRWILYKENYLLIS